MVGANGSPIPLWIIGGFLGSGKTTVLNRLISSVAPKPVAVLVNDFGKIGVDASLIKRDHDDGGITVVDLNGGQLFCSCISGSFVKRIVELTATPAGVIFVESSGMAKPGAMGPILAEAERRTGNGFRYAGMVTVVDAPRLEMLLSVVNAVEEQIVYADLVVLNKCDLVDPDVRRDADRRIRSINSRAAILEMAHGALRWEDLPFCPLSKQKRFGPAGEDYAGWAGKKPLCRNWNPGHTLSRDELAAEVTRLVDAGALRVKGYLSTSDGPVYVDAVNDRVELRPAAGICVEGLTIFEPATDSTQKEKR